MTHAINQIISTAPATIYLDLPQEVGFWEQKESNFKDFFEVTWSEDCATGVGIPYVRADLVPTPAASGAAPLTDERIAELWIEHGLDEDEPEGFARIIEREVRAALASPQVAPAPVPNGFVRMPVKLSDQMIEAALEGHYGKRPVREAGGARGISMRANGTDYSGEEAMRRMWKGLLSATPAQVAPQDDARDAARLDFLIEREAFVTASKTRIDPTLKYQCWSRDEDEDYRYLSGEHEHFDTAREAIDAAIVLSTPAAKPTEPTLPTQGEQSDD